MGGGRGRERGHACEPDLDPPVEPAVTVTGTRQRDAWLERVLPPVERVRPGLWSVPVPIPRSPLRYVLVYAIELPDGVALIDTGWPVEEAWDVLVAGLAEAGFAMADVRAVLVTHHHPDHAGLATRVREASGAWVGMHPAEAQAIERIDGEWLAGFLRHWMSARGAPVDEVEVAVGTLPLDLAELAENRPDRLIDDGALPLHPHVPLRAVWTPGHTQGHLCFVDEAAGLLFSGDHVLPRISPNIALMDDPGGATDPLSDFLTSLDAVAKLPVAEVLPAHEYRFAGLEQRVAQLRQHHEARLAELVRLVAEHRDASTYDLATRLTWSRPWDQIGPMRRAAVGETLAHLAALVRRGRIVRLDGPVDRWRIVSHP
jgi:glyoxylase-like metal-dependent hydrolase (beta-lactamase superfamily II)